MEQSSEITVALRSVCSINDGRQENEDNYLCKSGKEARFLRDQRETVEIRKDGDPDHWRLAVSDGIGGHGRGRQVAEDLITAVGSMPICRCVSILGNEIDKIHRKLQNVWHKKVKKAGATLCLLESLPNQQAALYHVGDSRLYAITQDSIECLTVDHVKATEQLLSGELTEQEWRQFVEREASSPISQAMILGENIQYPYDRSPRSTIRALKRSDLPPFLENRADRRVLNLKKNTLYLLSTDGLWGFRNADNWLSDFPKIYKMNNRPQDFIDTLFTQLGEIQPTEVAADNTTVIAFALK